MNFGKVLDARGLMNTEMSYFEFDMRNEFANR